MKATFQVKGMTCGACSASISHAVLATPGVADSMVLLMTEEAQIKYDHNKVSADQLKQIIEDCGFDAVLVSTVDEKQPKHITTIQILGMTCGACSALIKQALDLVRGVEESLVSLITEVAKVVHLATTSLNTLVEAVEDCGFDAILELLITEKPTSIITKLHVTGMTCGACLALISQALQQLGGVELAAVNDITEEAVVKHSLLVDPKYIVTTIEDCGFSASLTASTDLAHAPEHETEDEAKFQIYGIVETSDLEAIRSSIDNYFVNLHGVKSYNLRFATSGEYQEDQFDHLADELNVIFNPQLLGLRDLSDGLSAIDANLSFMTLNLIDQLQESQLKILSRVQEIYYWRQNFLWAAVIGIPVIILNWTHKLPPWNHWMVFNGLYWTLVIQLVLGLYVQFVLARLFLVKFVKCIRSYGRGALMDVLVSCSTMVSYTFSVVAMGALVWSGQTRQPPKTLFETTCMLVMFISFGKWLENRAKGATLTALSKLLQLTPTTCTIVSDKEKYAAFMSMLDKTPEEGFATRVIGVDLIQTGDIAIVLAGTKISADGRIIHGETEVDESLLTGESLPVHKKVGDNVIGGSINGQGVIHIEVTRSLKKSQLQQIINLVKESQVNRAPVQRFADYIASRFVPLVLSLSLFTFVIWSAICLVVHQDRLPMAFHNDENGRYFVCLKIAISVIVVACPCALGLAAPTAIMVGTGVGAKHGVLIKGGDVFEEVHKLNVLLFDKTGTLTTGIMKLVNFNQILTAAKLGPGEWWGIIGALEANSEHPIGKLIVRGAKEHLGLTFEDDNFSWRVSAFKVYPGLGLYGQCSMGGAKHEVYIGNYHLIDKMLPDLAFSSQLSDQVTKLEALMNTMAHVIVNGEYAGYVELTDEVKPGTKPVLDYLQHQQGYQVGIVTGDLRGAALKVAKELGIPTCNVFSEVNPADKDKVVSDLQRRLEGVGIGFIGDGINDAPALAKANVGMAISLGTDIAMESADIVLLGLSVRGNDVVGVANALSVLEATFIRIKWNFVWAVLYNMLMLPFAMGLFLPLNIMLPPIAAGAAMMVSSLSVVFNSLYLKRWTPPVYEVDVDEESVGAPFDLRLGSNEEFQLVKRGGNAWKRITRRWRSGNNDGYQLVNQS